MISVQDSGVSTLEYIRGILCAPGKQRIGCRGAEKQLYMLQYGLARSEDFSELQSITGSYGLACGVSDTFSDLAEISERRAQAMLSLTVGSGGFSTFRGSYAEIAECCAAEFYGPYASKLRSIEELAATTRPWTATTSRRSSAICAASSATPQSRKSWGCTGTR